MHLTTPEKPDAYYDALAVLLIGVIERGDRTPSPLMFASMGARTAERRALTTAERAGHEAYLDTLAAEAMRFCRKAQAKRRQTQGAAYTLPPHSLRGPVRDIPRRALPIAPPPVLSRGGRGLRL